MPKKSVLIFDLDGTLIDSVPDLSAALNLALASLGLPNITEETVRCLIGKGAYQLCQDALTTLQEPLEKTDALHEAFLSHYAHHSAVHSRAYAGVVSGLNDLRQSGYTLALATNKPERFILEILNTFNLGEFSVVVGGDSLPKKKPDPLPLLHICQTLGVATEAAVMIGDSKHDILAGKNAGITTLALSYGYNHGEDIKDSEPDAVFDEFSALVACLLTQAD
ncbi:MAG: phosphoglycolate phosphatase [Moraxella sp.]|nr:phosphoglycolate phosphatase [Moraxella sp.]